MNSPKDQEELDDSHRESTIRRPVPKYQHYIDHFEELYRQSPLAKVVDQNAFATPSSKHMHEDAMSGNTSGSFKVPLVSPVLKKPKPVPAAVGAFMMSPVAQLIQQMQSTGGASRKGTSSRSADTPREDGAQHAGGQVLEEEVAVQKEHGLGISGDLASCQPGPGKDVRSEDAEAVSAAEEDMSPIADAPSVMDVSGEMNGKTAQMQDVEDMVLKHSEPDSSDKPVTEASLGTVSKPRERRKSTRRKDSSEKSASDVKDINNGSSDDAAKLSKKAVTDLDQWIVKWLGSGRKHVAVEGHRLEDPEGSFWHSTSIAKRVSSTLLETSSGSMYRLYGNINKLLTMDQGFSAKFVRRFQKGFPAKWKAYLVEEAVEQSNNKVEVAAAESTDTETTKTSTAQGIKPRKETKHKTPYALKKEQKPVEKKTPVSQASSKVPETTPVTRKREAVVVTPSFVSVNELRTTKSGRKVLPPLQYWRGQRQRTLQYMDGAAELLEGSIDYTPVSATRLSVKGSIDISQRAKRLYSRKETPSSWKRREKSKQTTPNKGNSFQESESEDALPGRNQKKNVEAESEGNIDTSKTMKGDGQEHSPEELLQEKSRRRSTRKCIDVSDSATRTSSASSRGRGNCTESDVSSPDSARRVGTSKILKGNGKEHDLEGLPHDLEQGSSPRRSPRKSLDVSGHHSCTRSGLARQTGVPPASEVSSPVQRSGQDVANGSHPYDLYGSVMEVVKQHRHRRKSNQSRRPSRLASQSSLLAPEQENRADSFNISDDEDFKNESFASPSEGKEENSSLLRKSHPISSESNRTKSKHKRKSSSRASERVLLGSNMLPSVVLEKFDDNNSNSRVKSKSSPRAEEQDKAEQISKKTKAVQKTRSSKRIQKSCPQQEENDQVEKNEKWKPDEIHRLHRALKTIPPSSRQFWHRVAASVGTRTEWECQQAHQARLESTIKASKGNTKDKKESTQVAKEPVVLTAAKGTMRRKRQLRELIQQHNQASEDDLFDSTPFKKQRKSTMPLLNLDLGEEEEDEDEGAMTKTPGSARLKTPSTRFHNVLAPLSGKKTPHSSALTPGLLYSVERKHMDKYIFGMQKKRLGQRVKKVPEAMLHRSPPLKVRQKQVRTGSVATTPSLSEAFQVDPVQDVDSDEGEADYYWSDEENITVPPKQ